jgi:2-dehydro-3-deoxyphosphogluconate aldolase/(4S)-4-hydroxy-2-oxoglutarate aldolase
MSAPARAELPRQIVDGRVIAIARGLDPGRLPAVLDALVAAGITAVEITMNSPAALASIEAVRARTDGSSLTVGAGTVLDPTVAKAAVAAGAAFLVAPNVDLPTIAWAVSCGVPILPGAMTPTEILAAWDAGVPAVKVFPAIVLGPAFVREIRGPMPHIPLVPTGGVTADTALAFLDAGAVAVGIGGWLTGAGDPEAVSARARELRAAIDRR